MPVNVRHRDDVQPKKSQFAVMRQACDDSLEQYFGPQSTDIENKKFLAIVVGGAAGINTVYNWVMREIRKTAKEKKWSKNKLRKMVSVMYHHGNMSHFWPDENKCTVLIITEAFWEAKGFKWMHEYADEVVDMCYVHRPNVEDVEGFGCTTVQKVYEMDSTNYERRQRKVDSENRIRQNRRDNGEEWEDLQYHTRLSELQMQHMPTNPDSSGPSIAELRKLVPHKMIGFRLPVVRVIKNNLEGYLRAENMKKAEKKYGQPFAISEKKYHNLSPNELPLARILERVSADQELGALKQCSLVALVAASQVIADPVLNPLFSCMKTLMFMPYDTARYRFWVNIEFRNFIQFYGSSLQMGLAMMHLRGGFDSLENDLADFLGDRECKDVVTILIKYVLEVFEQAVANIVSELKTVSDKTFKWKGYDTNTELKKKQQEEVKRFLVAVYKTVCQDDSTLNCTGFVQNVTRNEEELPAMPETGKKKDMDFQYFKKLKQRLDGVTATNMFLDFQFQVNQWTKIMDTRNEYYDDIVFPHELIPKGVKNMEKFRKVARVGVTSFSEWVFSEQGRGVSYHLRRNAAELTNEKSTRTRLNLDEGLYVAHPSNIPTPFSANA